MQNEITSLLLPTVNAIGTIVSVIGIVHILQEKVTQSANFKKKCGASYFPLRGALSSLAAVQISTLFLPVTWPVLLLNLCTATISTITVKYFH